MGTWYTMTLWAGVRQNRESNEYLILKLTIELDMHDGPSFVREEAANLVLMNPKKGPGTIEALPGRNSSSITYESFSLDLDAPCSTHGAMQRTDTLPNVVLIYVLGWAGAAPERPLLWDHYMAARRNDHD